MLNQSGATTQQFGNRKMILEDDKVFFSMSCKIADTGVTAGADGKKIVLAGTPLVGDLKARETAFTVGAKDSAVVGIAMHDVDVTKGTANGTVLVFGFVNESKLESSVVALLDTVNTDTTKLRDKLTQITFVK